MDAKEWKDEFDEFFDEEENVKLLNNNQFKDLCIRAIEKGIPFDAMADLIERANLGVNMQKIKDEIEKEKLELINKYNEDMNLNCIPKKYFANNELLEKIDIRANINSLGDRCFENCKSLKRINIFGKGLLRGISGSYIFDGCESLKEVHADNIDVLHYRHDNNGTPYLKGVKVYVNEQEIIPISLSLTINPSTWDLSLGKKIIYLDNLCLRDNKGLNKKINEDDYYKILNMFNEEDHLLRKVQSSINTFDATTYLLEYNYLGWCHKIEWDGSLKENDKNAFDRLQKIVDAVIELSK